MTAFFRELVIPALIFLVFVFLVSAVLWRTGLARQFWKSAFWDDVAPDPDDECSPHALKVVTDEISPDELERFHAAETVHLAVRETSYFDTRFFWIDDGEYETGRLRMRSLMIALGIPPAALIPIFGRAAESEHVDIRDIQWDDLGGIPLKLGDVGQYNERPFRRLSTLLGKGISVELESTPLSKVRQCPTKLFVVQYEMAAHS